MKYYVCSPMGRTGSKRIMNGIQDAQASSNQKMYIHPIKSDLTPSPSRNLLDGFQVITEVKDKGSQSKGYTDDDAITLMDTWKTPIVCHSHNPTLLPTDSNDWTFILSTRRKKIDIAFSIIMGWKTKSFDPSHPVDPSFKAFNADIDVVKTLLKHTHILENLFIERVIKLTGDVPKTIFVEDTWEILEEKIGIELPNKKLDTSTISSHRADKYMLNYQEIIDTVNWK